MQIKNEKTLTPSEEVVKELLENLLILAVNLTKLKEAKPQRQMVLNIIKALKNKKKSFTYKDLFNWLLWLMKTAQNKETIAISSKLFQSVQKAYKQNIKNNS